MPKSDSVETAQAAPVLRVDAGDLEQRLRSAEEAAIRARWDLDTANAEIIRLVDALHADVAAEREACAQAARNVPVGVGDNSGEWVRDEIVAAIRARGKA